MVFLEILQNLQEESFNKVVKKKREEHFFLKKTCNDF